MSFPPGTEMFQFPGFASYAYVFSIRSSYEGVSPFGYPWIKACSRLPMAFRSVPRPSSPPGAKASTECPYRALDHATNLIETSSCTEAKHENSRLWTRSTRYLTSFRKHANYHSAHHITPLNA